MRLIFAAALLLFLAGCGTKEEVPTVVVHDTTTVHDTTVVKDHGQGPDTTKTHGHGKGH